MRYKNKFASYHIVAWLRVAANQCWEPQVFFKSAVRKGISIFLIHNRKYAIVHLKA